MKEDDIINEMLEDARKELAETQNDLKAEKLFFKQDGNLIPHKEETRVQASLLSESTRKYLVRTKPSLYVLKMRFLDQKKSRISVSDENELILGDILSIDDILTIYCKREHDQIKLINQCGYGFIVKNGSVEQVKYSAFRFKKASEYKFERSHENSSFECESEFSELCNRNFITFGNAKASSMPEKSICEYLKDTILVDTRFIEEVEEALKEDPPNKKVESLQKIAEKYGYFYASTVYFGGVIVEKIEDIKYSSEHVESDELNATLDATFNVIGRVGTGINYRCTKQNGAKYVIVKYNYTIKGGDISKFDKREEWTDSFNKDSGNWEIIEYQNIHSIFSLLEEGCNSVS
ncbi:hypothetical protein C2G38_2030453 [Gigaspora rosea]|uniref:MACPF domain-containing protein n=1 Tax=Gigaspora rosea TaxID=44941 RepID=A0A397VXT6_9GLOM|nr:hypothetical protein C2G38_2030453 [Gigaspora rosea]